MYFTLYPELAAVGEFPANELHAELVEAAIDDFLMNGDSYGCCYSTILDLVRAGF